MTEPDDKPLLPIIPPGEILLEVFMRPRGISQNQLARDLDVPVSRVAGLVAGTRAITADTALRLAATFATSAELWLNLQSAYDLRVARRATGEMIAAQVRRSRPPVAEASRPATTAIPGRTLTGAPVTALTGRPDRAPRSGA